MTTPSTSTAEHSPIPATPLKPIFALLLDDSLFDQHRIRRLTEETRLLIQLDIVGSIDDLASRLDETDYDVALLDYHLPVGTGADALELLRKHASQANCATIMIAGDEPCRGARSMQARCDAFISKDKISAEILRNHLLAMLSSNAVAQPHKVDENRQAMLVDGVEEIIRRTRSLRTMLLEEEGEHLPNLSEIERRAIQVWLKVRQYQTVAMPTGTLTLGEADEPQDNLPVH